jgi:hypothetical protein
LGVLENSCIRGHFRVRVYRVVVPYMERCPSPRLYTCNPSLESFEEAFLPPDSYNVIS